MSKKTPHKDITDRLHYMASRLKGLQETKHFGAKRRARHKDAQKRAKGLDTF